MSKIKEIKADNLTVKMFDSRQAMGENAAKEAASKIKELLAQKPEINMIFAAAPSQNEFLDSLIGDKGIEWDRINAFHMDEYIGISKDAPQAFGNFLKDKIFGKVNFKSVNYIDVSAKDAEKECERYSKLLKKYPADIICLGIGENGHIAFNDPPVADFNDKKLVKVVELDEKCRQQQVNDGCFKTLDDVPKYALTLTIPALIAGKYLFCIVPGSTKTEAVTNTINGEISEACPASILRTHKNAILYVDKDSGKDIL
ncbi:MAG TPA: glucosamine-6-phosphate deaminase [Clostridiaceae bacterium]|jgi:glucosamine-6-phosphate deaminase|nr:glucosamine-6-phosphate deaminase [Clostridiaceae bacterium]